MGYMRLKNRAAAAVPTPATDYKSVFFDTADSKAKFKDEAGDVKTLLSVASDGTAGQAAVTDGAGNVSFQTIQTKLPCVVTNEADNGVELPVNKRYILESVTAAFNRTLPASATLGDVMEFVVSNSDIATNPFTIYATGSEGVDGPSANYVFNKNNYTLQLVYGSFNYWYSRLIPQNASQITQLYDLLENGDENSILIANTYYFTDHDGVRNFYLPEAPANGTTIFVDCANRSGSPTAVITQITRSGSDTINGSGTVVSIPLYEHVAKFVYESASAKWSCTVTPRTETIPVDIATPTTSYTPKFVITKGKAISRITLDENLTINAPQDYSGTYTTTNLIDGTLLQISLKQGVSGGPYTVTWDSAYRFSTSTPSPTLSTAAGDIDVVLFQWNATDSKWDCLAYNLGY